MTGQYGFEESDVKLVSGNGKRESNEDINSEKEIAFLKIVIEKQFFSHAGLARVYAYNKLVEGLYRPGYFEALGNVILKRFLLLVPILDKAKSQSCLPIKYGVDGLDGGSPLLFTLQPNIKSSCQMIRDFLSLDVMHGEGNVPAHLVIVGYKVSYLQSPFNEYDFRVKELFEDLQDGVRLCRAIQLLQHDASILTKMLVPPDTHKKNVVNCGVALQHLKQAGVPLFDEDGSMIVAEDIVSGDKELTLSLLWNIFVHLQLPLLINKTLILEEISRIQGVNAEHLNNSTLLDMLPNWIQDIRETSGETSIMSVCDYTDAVHNFILSQKLTTLLGNFPEVLQVSDILEHNGPCNSQSVIILLVFLSFQLLVRKNTEQLNFLKLLGFTCQSPERRCLSMDQCFAHSEAILNQEDRHVYNTEENAAKIIQSRFRQSLARNNYLRIKNAVTFSQTVIRAWLAVKKKSAINKFCTSRVQELSFEKQKQSGVLGRYITYMVDRHNFVKLKRSATIIEHATRAWISRRHHGGSILTQDMSTHDVVNATIAIQKCILGSTVRSIYFQRVSQLEKVSLACEETEVNDCQIKAASTIQLAWKKFLVHKSLCLQNLSATKIQSCYCGWLMRKSFVIQSLSATKIQSCYHGWLMRKSFVTQSLSATKIQSCYRGWLMRKRFIMIQKHIKAAFNIQLAWKKFLMNKAFRLQNLSATKIQSCSCGWFRRKSFVLQKQAALKIQKIQRFVRGRIARRRLLGASFLPKTDPTGCIVTSTDCFQNLELDMATKHSLKCCEKLVEAGAVDTLLKLIHSVSRSIPDKHALSTLRNLARYSHLTEVLICSRGSVETILWKNKEEDYFIASELLRKICLNTKGVEAARNLPALLKRLHNLVEDLTRKTCNEKR
ncbi:hypothetical protein LOK49_LG09G00343 [Camellia lanceoleosa]|uniref:Uncharacterized protein n=1 Tax=Camellia lanceoleosa TaxID=1840588 RepID=A0ACC0GJN3_9ERIC|nr:hypothetical protein LOK49_LG09G00343 [Camellia lanceoleosa]